MSSINVMENTYTLQFAPKYNYNSNTHDICIDLKTHSSLQRQLPNKGLTSDDGWYSPQYVLDCGIMRKCTSHKEKGLRVTFQGQPQTCLNLAVTRTLCPCIFNRAALGCIMMKCNCANKVVLVVHPAVVQKNATRCQFPSKMTMRPFVFLGHFPSASVVWWQGETIFHDR